MDRCRYFVVALVSMMFNLVIMAAYIRGVKQANQMSTVASVFNYIVLAGHIVVWGLATAFYRHGKEPVGGKEKDLWGWTCSDSAKVLQLVFSEQLNFDHLCSIQTASFGVGIATTVSSILSAVIFYLAVRRMRSKKQMASLEGSKTAYSEVYSG